MQNGWWLLAAFVSGYASAFSGHYLQDKVLAAAWL